MSDVDPTRITAQDALQSGRRRQWLVPGGAFALIVVAMFVAALQLQTVVPMIGILLAVGFFLAMLVTAVTVADAHIRNRLFAWLMGGMAAVSLACAVALMFIEWTTT